MFFPGTLQEAVALAIQQDRSLACFVTDDAEESAMWENTYFTDEEAAPLLAQCMLLKLQAGSVEAGFLAAFCPMQDVPYFTVIKHGALVVNMKAGDSREDFVRQLKSAFVEPQGEPQAAEAAEAAPPAQPPAPAAQSISRSPASTPAPASVTPSRLPAAASEAPGRAENSSFVQQQRKRQQEASEERQRVLQLLENDKKEREARRKKNVVGDKASSAPIAERGEQKASKSHSSNETAISFRMLDGLSLRAKFPSSATLATEVRKFVDENRTDGDHPYSFLQILAPLPNKQITISEENSALSELGLSPTCTLVLVPASSTPASAYSGGGGSTEGVGIFSRICGLFYSISQSLPTASLSSLSDASASSSSGQAPSREVTPNARIRTLYDGRGSDREEADRKYYNGNQLDFEPKKDEDSGDGGN